MKYFRYIIIFLLIMVLSNQNQIFLADKEITFAFCESSGILKALNIIGKVITVIKIMVPIILIITSIKSLFNAILAEDDSMIKKSIELFIVKICVGAMVFFIPTIIGTVFSVVHDYDKTKIKFSECGTCFMGTNKCQTMIVNAEKKEKNEMLSRAEEDKKQNNNNFNKNDSLNNNLTENVTPINTISYGKGCSGYVSSSSYNENIAKQILNRANTKLGVSYKTMDCSDFVSYVYSSYVPDSTAAGLGKVTNKQCVKPNDVRPGDIFFSSNYDKNGVCKHCNGTTFGNRCNRYNCIMHVGIVTEVVDGKITKIIHSSGTGVHYKVPTYSYTPNGSGSSWFIGISRPYA